MEEKEVYYNSSVRLLTYEESALVVLIYTLISIVAAFGNLTVIFIILNFPRMRTPTNFLILNLCIADLLMAALCIPFSYWPILLLQRWPFGLILCKVISFSQAAVVMSSAYTLVAISIDRFIAIVCPMTPWLKLTKRRSIIAIWSVWTVSMIIASPLLIVMDLMEDELNPGAWHCVEDWTTIHGRGEMGMGLDSNLSTSTIWNSDTDDGASMAALVAAYHYSVAAMVLQYFLPLVVLIVTYSGIGLRLWYSKVPGEGGKDVMKGRQDSVKKMMPTMFIVTATYAICWCPLNVLNILTGIYISLTEYRYILYIWGCCHFLAMFNSCANPIIYFSRNKKFRDGFRYVFRWLPFVKNIPNPMLNISAAYGGNVETPAGKFTTLHSGTRTTFVKRISERKMDFSYAPVSNLQPAYQPQDSPVL